MASVAFSTVGHAVGGAFGGIAGAVVGAGIDSVALGRRNDRSAEFQVQRSAYGVEIPRVFGVARVAGVLIWARISGSGGKGSGDGGGRCSMAVAVSSRSVQDIGRVWADGREIRGADGLFQWPVTMRLHGGVNRYRADPVVEAVEGVGSAPAFANLSYVVFEDLSLEPFAGRIPNLSFEVVADGGTADDWLAELVGTASLGVPSAGLKAETVSGYIAAGGALADDVEPLLRIARRSVSYFSGALFAGAEGAVLAIPQSDLCADRIGEVGTAKRLSENSHRPKSLSIVYQDKNREFQHGIQTVGQDGHAALELRLPFAADGSSARTLAMDEYRKLQDTADSVEIFLSLKWLGLSIGDVFAMEGEPGRWRVSGITVRGMSVGVRANRHRQPMQTELAGDGGRGLPSPAIPGGPTAILVFEASVPLAGNQPGVWIHVNGDAGWRGASIKSLDEGQEHSLGVVESRSSKGLLLEAASDGTAHYWDEVGSFLVALADPALMPHTRDALAVLRGANMVRIGAEIAQFREVQQLSPDVIRLRGLLRGRFGTERAICCHPVGQDVTFLNPDQLLCLPVGPDFIGRDLSIVAAGWGDPAGGLLADVRVTGACLGPLAPVHVQVARKPDSSLVSSWIPRGREAFSWDGGEPQWHGGIWRYEGGDGVVFEQRVAGLTFELDAAAQRAAIGRLFSGGRVSVEANGAGPVRQRTSNLIQI